MHKHITVAVCGLLSGPAFAGELTVSIEIPRLNVAEYHRPYVAVWLERADQSHAANLAVWYDLKLKNGEGTKWLKDLRQWWRRSGRELDLPLDGLTSPTRAAGKHELTFSDTTAPLTGLAPGEYRLVVEAAREVGGRELLSLPFKWPVDKAARQSVAGKHELGAVRLSLQP